jgi:F-type H+-transporting ATPase subunit epsilon
MADSTFTLEILTPSRRDFEGEVVSLAAPGIQGYLGVLAHHAPLITPLMPGHIEVRLPDGDVDAYYVSGGFLEVSGNHAIVLADDLQTVAEIDLPEAEAAVAAAREARKEITAVPELARAEQELAQAKARLRAGKRQRGDSH